MKSIDGEVFFITGGAGFIGSNMAEWLLREGAKVVVYDNLSTGKLENIKGLEGKVGFAFIKGDLLDVDSLRKAMDGRGITTVIHLAANGDIRSGVADTSIDLHQGTIATYNILEASRINKVKNFMFSSSSAVYGVAKVMPTPEDYPLRPISLYAAAKICSEAQICAFSNLFGMNCYIYRYANVIGRRQQRGIVIDLLAKLKKNGRELEVLGDGNQKKSYIDVNDVIEGMLLVFKKCDDSLNIYNIGNEDRITAREIAEMVVAKAAKNAKIRYTGTKSGWPGDVPETYISIDKIRKLDFATSKNSKESLDHSINIFLGN